MDVHRTARDLGYKLADRAARDIISTVIVYSHLEVQVRALTRSDGHVGSLLCLWGTIPTQVGSNTYATPVCIYLPESYPEAAPVVHLEPTPEMAVVRRARAEANYIVDPAPPHRITFLPALDEWHFDSSTLDLCVEMNRLFSAKPPLNAVAQGAGGAPRAQSAAVAAAAPAPVQRQPPPAMPAPAPAPAPSDAQRREQLIANLTPTLRRELEAALRAARDAADGSSDDCDALTAREQALAAGAEELRVTLVAQRAHAGELARRAGAISAWLDARAGEVIVGGAAALALSSSSSSSSLGGGMPSGAAVGRASRRSSLGAGAPAAPAAQHEPPPSSGTAGVPTPSLPAPVSVEDVVVPTSRLQEQLLEAVAEDVAIEGLYAHLSAALGARRISLDDMLKEVRKLANRQFTTRALARKIDAALAAARISGASTQGGGGGAPLDAATRGMAPMGAVSGGQGRMPGR